MGKEWAPSKWASLAVSCLAVVGSGCTDGPVAPQAATTATLPDSAVVLQLPVFTAAPPAAGGPPADGFAAVFDGAVSVLVGKRTDFEWAPELEYSKGKGLSGVTRGIEYAKRKLGCDGTPIPRIGFRTQVRQDWYLTAQSAPARDTLEYTVVPLACGGAPRGASAAIVIAGVRNQRSSMIARLAFRRQRGEAEIYELMPDGSVGKGNLGDLLFLTAIEVTEQIAPRVGITARAVLSTTRNAPVIETLRGLLSDASPTNLLPAYAPWLSFSWNEQRKQDAPTFFYRFGSVSTFKRSPSRSILQRIGDLAQQTFDLVKAKLPERASNYLLDVVFSQK